MVFYPIDRVILSPFRHQCRSHISYREELTMITTSPCGGSEKREEKYPKNWGNVCMKESIYKVNSMRRHARHELRKVNTAVKIAAVLTWCYLIAMLLLTAYGIVEMPSVVFWYVLYAASAMAVVVSDDNSGILLKAAVFWLSSLVWTIIGTILRILYWGLSEIPNIPSFWASSIKRTTLIAGQFKNVDLE